MSMLARAAQRRHKSRCGLEQIELLRRRPRRPEMLGRGLYAGQIEAEPLAGDFEAAADHPGNRSGACHAFAEGRIVVLAAAGVADQLEHMLDAIGKILGEPLAKQIAEL